MHTLLLKKDHASKPLLGIGTQHVYICSSTCVKIEGTQTVVCYDTVCVCAMAYLNEAK